MAAGVGGAIAAAVMGGGGEAQSRVKNKLSNTIINKNGMDLLNEQVNTVSTNVIIKHANKCKVKVSQSQMYDLTGATMDELTIGTLSQEMKSVANFDCINRSKVRGDIVGNVSGRITNMLLGSYDNKALSKMVATAKAKGESEIMSNPPKVNAEIDLENHNKIVTDIDRKIHNIVKHTVNNNFTSDTVNACAPMSNQYQAFLARYADICTLKTGDINQKMVGKMIDQPLRGEHHDRRLWRVLMFELWLQNYFG